MNRREFSSLMAGAALSNIFAPSLAGKQSEITPPEVSQAAAELYKRALILDCNSAGPGEDGSLPLPQAALDMVRDSGVNVIKWSLGGINADFDETMWGLSVIQRMIEAYPTYFVQVRIPADMDRAKAERKLGIIFSFETTDMIEGDLERFELFRNLGVRVMQLSYNLKSPYGAGVMAPTGGGLTVVGRQVVGIMNSKGIAIDLSHANQQTTADATAASTKPVIMSHAGCDAVHQHPRNKTDDQLRAMANKGGVVGIYDLPYLTASPKQPAVEDYMAHTEHALKVAGEDHVGVGSDVGIGPFDTSPASLAGFKKSLEARQKAGIAAPEEDRPLYVEGMNTPRKIEIIADQLLKGGYPARVTEKIVGANFARVLGEIWTT